MSQLIQIVKSSVVHLNHDIFHWKGELASQYKVRELSSEKVRVDLVIVQEKTSPLLSSEVNAGVESRINEL
jgi:hypothetical protein